MTADKAALKQEFLEKIDFKKLSANKLQETIVIGFIASIGSGKSTISKALSKRLKIPIFDNDGIRRFLNKRGHPGESPLPQLVLDIARTRAKMILNKGISYILDADLTLTYPEDTHWLASMGAKLLLIKINCPKKIVLQRLSRRQKDTAASLANKQRYLKREKLRKKVQIEPDYLFFTIDNTKDLTPQINRLISKIHTPED
jgi:dephospho-CoA kinase